MEFVELPRDVHPYYVSTQAHPEFLSRPNRAHPLFAGLVGAALDRQRGERLVEVERHRAAAQSEQASRSGEPHQTGTSDHADQSGSRQTGRRPVRRVRATASSSTAASSSSATA